MTFATSSGSPRRLISMKGRSSLRIRSTASSMEVPSSFGAFSIMASVIGV